MLVIQNELVRCFIYFEYFFVSLKPKLFYSEYKNGRDRHVQIDFFLFNLIARDICF